MDASFEVRQVELREDVRYTDGHVNYRSGAELSEFIEIDMPSRLTEPTTVIYQITFVPRAEP